MRIKVLCVVPHLMTISLCAAAVRFEQSDRSVDRFDFVEVTLNVSNAPAGNPFLEAAVTGEFSREGAAPVQVDGFCDSDDGSVFRIRFMPTQAGKHNYSGPTNAREKSSGIRARSPPGRGDARAWCAWTKSIRRTLSGRAPVSISSIMARPLTGCSELQMKP